MFYSPTEGFWIESYGYWSDRRRNIFFIFWYNNKSIDDDSLGLTEKGAEQHHYLGNFQKRMVLIISFSRFSGFGISVKWEAAKSFTLKMLWLNSCTFKSSYKVASIKWRILCKCYKIGNFIYRKFFSEFEFIRSLKNLLMRDLNKPKTPTSRVCNWWEVWWENVNKWTPF